MAGFLNWPWGQFWDPGVVRNGFLAKFHAGLTYLNTFSMDFLKIVIFRSAIKPRCAYFFGFKRFSKNRQNVHKMAQTEATVTSAVKNWYINFFIGIVGPWEMPIGAKTMIFVREIGVFRLQGFPGPPKGPRKKKVGFFWCPGALGPPSGPRGARLR